MKKVSLLPKASSLLYSMRDIGYSLEFAIADIIDNSITAKSANVYIDFSWQSGTPYICITDDGYGMSDENLQNAMRIGSQSPLLVRGKADLGRFGLGLKTASFSFCKCLTVISKKNNIISGYKWDLNKLSESNDSWYVFKLDNSEIQNGFHFSLFNKYLSNKESGTIVLWEDIDRLSCAKNNSINEKNFNENMNDVKKHIELVFHRFFEEKLVKIFFNNCLIEGIDPFNSKHIATQEMPVQNIYINKEEVKVQPYILPHINKIDRNEYKKYELNKGGYLHNQGFYVYRNKRLIIWGTWFNLLKKEELNKLIRVRIDISNNMDSLWKIDIKKSSAMPSKEIKEELKDIILKIEERGKEVYKRKGHSLKKNIKDKIWERKISDDKVYFQINKKHLLINKLLKSLDKKQTAIFNDIIQSIENFIPFDDIYYNYSSDNSSFQVGEFKEEDLFKLYNFYVTEFYQGMEKEEIYEKLIEHEFFYNKENLLKKFIKKSK